VNKKNSNGTEQRIHRTIVVRKKMFEGDDHMIITFAVLLSFFIILGIIRSLRNRHWSLIWTAFGYEAYFKVMAKLKSEGITCKVETPDRGLSNRTDRFKDNTQYDIYVKKEEEHKAIAALQRDK
jgi:hypothetical protein